MSRRKGALFLPLDVGFPDDDRIVEAGEKPAWLYVCMMLSAKRLGTDGVLSTRQIDRLNVSGWESRLRRLLDVGLVVELEPDVYLVRAWLNHNDPIAVVVERRERDAARKREGASARNPNGVGSEPVRSPDVEKRREEKRREEKPEPLLLDEVERAPARRGSVVPELFAEWWQVYPRKVGKAAALKAYERAVRRTTATELLRTARVFRDDPTREDAYTPHPATWLNQGRWEDEGPARPVSHLRPVGRVAEGDAILREAYERATAQQQPEIGA